MSSAHQKLSIQHHLASILNLSPTDDEDYISEILEQLLSIESEEDVAEYLGNFVTDESSGDVALFVEELGRFRSGDTPSTAAVDAPMKTEESPVQASATSNRILDEGAAQREEIRLRELEAREKQREEQERLRMKKEDEAQQRRRESKSMSSLKEKSQSSTYQTAPTQKQAAKQSTTNVKKAAAKSATTKVENNTLPSKPLKGTPKTICGCFGNKHKPLTNCLRCGRISCEVEGYDYCPFCNHLVTQFKSKSSNKNDLALAHKERLLEYDRTSASRTHVHDDQEDYFVTQSSMWSSADEQLEAGALEEERRKKLHNRGNQVLDIKF